MQIIELKSAEDVNYEAFKMLKTQLYNHQEQVKLAGFNPFQHPYFYKAFGLVYKEKPMAHATLYHNPSLHITDQKTICIGNYECVDNTDISKAFLDHMIYAAKQSGATQLIGPMNGSTWDNYRFSDKRNDDSFFLEPYNKVYYNQQFLNAGLEKIGSYFSAIDDSMDYNNPALIQREKELVEQGIVFRNIDTDNYENDLKKVYELCLESFADNFLFTPITWEDFKQKYSTILPFINKDFVLFAEDNDSKLCGFIFCIPNIFDPRQKQIIIKTIARKKGRNFRGLGDILGEKITAIAKQAGYNGIIHALMFSDNTSLNLSKKHSGKTINTYSLYAANI